MADFQAIGARLRAHRDLAGWSAEQAAQHAGISRALLYRYEGGEVVKLEVLERLASLYGSSLSALLGLGQEYATHGMVFFDRVQRLEEAATQLTIVFGPYAYLLTSDAYDRALRQQMTAPGMGQLALSAPEAQRLMHILQRRKAVFAAQRTALVNIIPLGDLQRYLSQGLGGHAKLSEAQRARRRALAREDVCRLMALISAPPMGVQIGISTQTLPISGFEIIHQREGAVLVQSPFRVVEPLNLHYGVATFSQDAHALRLHQQLADALWETALKSAAAIQAIKRLLREA